MMEVKQAVSILKAKLECDERDTSGNYELCNNKCECCYLNYEQGTKGERKESLKMAIEALEQEPCEDAVSLASVFEILGNLMAIPYDLDRPINKDDVSESMDKIRALSSE